MMFILQRHTPANSWAHLGTHTHTDMSVYCFKAENISKEIEINEAEEL